MESVESDVIAFFDWILSNRASVKMEGEESSTSPRAARRRASRDEHDPAAIGAYFFHQCITMTEGSPPPPSNSESSRVPFSSIFHINFKFHPVPSESIEEKEVRLHEELQRFRDLGSRPITAIPYEYVGQDIRGLYPKTVDEKVKRNYQDWHMLTPAYKLSFSGMTSCEHFVSLFRKSSRNNLYQRIYRWVKEEKVVTYCDWLDKLSSFASMTILVMTFAFTCSEMYMGATMEYRPNTPEEGSADMAALNALNRQREIWNFVKLLLSGIPTAVMTFNAFKRTTLPKRNVIIINFKKGLVASSQRILPDGPREDTMSSITHPYKRRTLAVPQSWKRGTLLIPGFSSQTKRRMSAHSQTSYIPPP